MDSTRTKKEHFDMETVRIALVASFVGAVGLLALWGGVTGTPLEELGTLNALGILTGLFGGIFGGILLAAVLGQKR